MDAFKNLSIIICIIAFLTFAAFVANDLIKTNKKTVPKSEKKGFAVLELFTSEGCSSCPAADELMAKIQQEERGKPVYLLVYHVDYWDRQGWKDRFSNADYSRRQMEYGHILNAQIYTPQLILNGGAEFVGSDEEAIRDAIAGVLDSNQMVSLTFEAHQDKDRLEVHYQTSTIIKGNNLLLALVQKSAQTNVVGGENAGRSLSHVQIVRKLQTESLNESGNGDVTVDLPKGFDSRSWEVLGLIQDKGTGAIKAAAKVIL